MKVTELKKIFCGKKNSCREVLKIKLVRKKMVVRCGVASKSLQAMTTIWHRKPKKSAGGFDPKHNISRRPDCN